MSSITIHDLDNTLAALVRARARAEGRSLNHTIKRLLEEALGVKVTRHKHAKDFEKFCGMWSKEQAAAFRESISDLEQVDARDWR
jgi:hypothetical protein